MSCRIVRSVREAMIGSGTPSIHTRVRCPPPRSLPSDRLDRVDLVRARVLAEAEEDHPSRAVRHGADYALGGAGLVRFVGLRRTDSSGLRAPPARRVAPGAVSTANPTQRRSIQSKTMSRLSAEEIEGVHRRRPSDVSPTVFAALWSTQTNEPGTCRSGCRADAQSTAIDLRGRSRARRAAVSDGESDRGSRCPRPRSRPHSRST